MFNIRIVAQQGNRFDGLLYKDKDDIGGIGKDDKGIYINLTRKLTIQETIDLLKYINGLKMDYFREQLEIRYI